MDDQTATGIERLEALAARVDYHRFATKIKASEINGNTYTTTCPLCHAVGQLYFSQVAHYCASCGAAGSFEEFKAMLDGVSDETLALLISKLGARDHGGGWYLALCPFHEDHEPSFSFNRITYTCLACGANGRTVNFDRDVEAVAVAKTD